MTLLIFNMANRKNRISYHQDRYEELTSIAALSQCDVTSSAFNNQVMVHAKMQEDVPTLIALFKSEDFDFKVENS